MRQPLQRAGAAVLAGTLAIAGVTAAATAASAAPTFGLDRVAGVDRYETSAAIARTFAAVPGPPITDVILASGEPGRTPDALAASFLAGVRNAPVVLTRASSTPASVRSALQALRAQGATRLTIVGGTIAISQAQATSLRDLGFTTVERRGGANRYETAREIVEAGDSASASNVGLVASGVSTIDALAGGPLAYKGRHPVLLVTRDGIPGATLRAIRSAGVTSVYVLGGEAVVGARVVSQLATAGVSVTARLAGADRSETSARIAEAMIANFGFSANTFNLASGANEGVDALSGAALSGRENRALLVTNTATSAGPVVAFAGRNTTTLTGTGRIFGGTAVVTPALETQVEAGGGGTSGPVSLASATVLQGGVLTGTIVGDFSSVTVTGCGLNQVLAADDNTAAGGRQFTLTLPATQPAGSCSLQFTATPSSGGAAVVQTVSVTVTPTVGGPGPAPDPGPGPDPVIPAPTPATATVTVEAGSGAASDDISVGVTFTPGAESVVIQRAPVSGGADEGTTGTVGTYMTVATPTATTGERNAGALVYVDVDVPAGLHRYRVAAVDDGNQGPFSEGSTNELSVTPVVVVPATATVTVEAGSGGTANDITVSVTFTPGAESLVIQRAPVSGGTDEGTSGILQAPFADVATPTATVGERAAGALVFIDEQVPAGVYRYRVAAVDDGVQGPFSGESANEESPAPSFLAVDAVDASADLRLVYNKDVACGTVDLADYAVTLEGGTILPLSRACLDNVVTLTFGTPFVVGDEGLVEVVDGAVVLDLLGNAQDDADDEGFEVDVL